MLPWSKKITSKAADKTLVPYQEVSEGIDIFATQPIRLWNVFLQSPEIRVRELVFTILLFHCIVGKTNCKPEFV